MVRVFVRMARVFLRTGTIFLRMGGVVLGIVGDFLRLTRPTAESGEGFARTSSVANKPDVPTAAVNRPRQMKNVPSRCRSARACSQEWSIPVQGLGVSANPVPN